MDKKSFIALALIGLFVGFTIAQVTVRYWHPNYGTIITSSSLEMYLDGNATDLIPGELYTNTSSIEWGDCEPGYTYYFDNLTVVNTGTTTLNVTIITKDLPVDWTLTWLGNKTVLSPTEKIDGPLNLTIPVSASSWPSWGFYLVGEQA